MSNHRRRRILLAVAAATAVASTSFVGGPAPAGAHDAKQNSFLRTYYDGRQCTDNIAQQNHGGSSGSIARYVNTLSSHMWSDGQCHYHSLPPGGINHRGFVYKVARWGAPGELCIAGGWQHNISTSYYLTWSTTNNLWDRCNYWPYLTIITHDIDTNLWNPYTNGFNYGKAVPYPTTAHEYCCGPN